MALIDRFQWDVSGYYHTNTNLHQHNPDDAYLTYYDSKLTYEDYNTLREDWLTDNVISFWEEHLEREYLSLCDTTIILLRPSMSFLLMNTFDPNTLKNVLPDLTHCSHIFIPVNDCRDVTEAEGGTHWSLLVVSLTDARAFHYDSLPPGNSNEAMKLTHNLSILCQKELSYLDMRGSPTQQNSTDCGIFVCITMRYLLQFRLLRASANQMIDMNLRGKELDASVARKEMMQIINQLKKKQDRRRSYVTSSSSFITSPSSSHISSPSTPSQSSQSSQSSSAVRPATRHIPHFLPVSPSLLIVLCSSAVAMICVIITKLYSPHIFDIDSGFGLGFDWDSLRDEFNTGRYRAISATPLPFHFHPVVSSTFSKMYSHFEHLTRLVRHYFARS
ncbi:hypothetical protein FQN57_004668 [Myotisia sp. PD_48]|nr:hypothetical protein FQN57_004668 [Myotisia sp. PD_48]